MQKRKGPCGKSEACAIKSRLSASRSSHRIIPDPQGQQGHLAARVGDLLVSGVAVVAWTSTSSGGLKGSKVAGNIQRVQSIYLATIDRYGIQ